jgi:hypothetical protein
MSDSKSTKDLKEEYKAQSMPSASRVNYKGPTGKEDSFETKAHTGNPYCYDCCGMKCHASFIGIIAVTVVCCAYVSQKGTCCSICYWPF